MPHIILLLLAISLWGVLVIFVFKIIPLCIELGKLRQERETGIVPEIRHLKETSEILRRDIERVISGDQYTITHWKEIIERDKIMPHISELLKFKK